MKAIEDAANLFRAQVEALGDIVAEKERLQRKLQGMHSLESAARGELEKRYRALVQAIVPNPPEGVWL